MTDAPAQLAVLRTPPQLLQMPGSSKDRLTLLRRAAAEIGDVSHCRFGVRDSYLFVHPDAIQHILLANHRNYKKGPDLVYLKPVIGDGLITSEGAFHLYQRRMIQPAFHRARIAQYGASMTSYTSDALDRWHEGMIVDMAREMTRLTLRIVMQLLCGLDIDDADEPSTHQLQTALGHLSGESNALLPNSRRAARELTNAVDGIVAVRRAAGDDKGDLLGMLLGADVKNGEKVERMSDRQARDEIMTFFFAGHDTTASALAWAWYLLALHPEVQERLHEEVDRVLGGRTPTADDVAKLTYATAVFAETVRLYPPVWSIHREAVADDSWDGYRIPQGMNVMVSPYLTQRDPRFYDDPERFDPTRFHLESDVRRSIPRFAYFPFGVGTRQCMGEPFAWMQGTLLLATVAQRVRVHPVATSEVAPLATITLHPKNGIPLRIERR